MFPALDHARKCSYRIHTYLGNVTEDLVTLGSGRRLDILRIEQPRIPLESLGRRRRLALESKDSGVFVQ